MPAIAATDQLFECPNEGHVYPARATTPTMKPLASTDQNTRMPVKGSRRSSAGSTKKPSKSRPPSHFGNCFVSERARSSPFQVPRRFILRTRLPRHVLRRFSNPRGVFTAALQSLWSLWIEHRGVYFHPSKRQSLAGDPGGENATRRLRLRPAATVKML
jgi:hypothetical protein